MEMSEFLLQANLPRLTKTAGKSLLMKDVGTWHVPRVQMEGLTLIFEGSMMV